MKKTSEQKTPVRPRPTSSAWRFNSLPKWARIYILRSGEYMAHLEREIQKTRTTKL